MRMATPWVWRVPLVKSAAHRDKRREWDVSEKKWYLRSLDNGGYLACWHLYLSLATFTFEPSLDSFSSWFGGTSSKQSLLPTQEWTAELGKQVSAHGICTNFPKF